MARGAHEARNTLSSQPISGVVRIDEALPYSLDLSGEFAGFEVVGVTPSSDGSVSYVKCRTAPLKTFRLAVRNDNPEHRFLFDGGL